MDGESGAVPRREVRRLPDTAESIFWPAEMSIVLAASLVSLIVTSGLEVVKSDEMACPCKELVEWPCPRADDCWSSVPSGSDTKRDIKYLTKPKS